MCVRGEGRATIIMLFTNQFYEVFYTLTLRIPESVGACEFCVCGLNFESHCDRKMIHNFSFLFLFYFLFFLVKILSTKKIQTNICKNKKKTIPPLALNRTEKMGPVVSYMFFFS